MGLKVTGSIYSKRARKCLKCGSELKKLKDDVINTCQECGQQHYVDITGNSLALTVYERPELRHRVEEIRVLESIPEDVDAITDQLRTVKTELISARRSYNAALKENLALTEENKELRDKVIKLTNKLMHEQLNAKEWEQAADGLASELEKLKANGAW